MAKAKKQAKYSASEIVEKSGMSKTAFYRFKKSKDWKESFIAGYNDNFVNGKKNPHILYTEECLRACADKVLMASVKETPTTEKKTEKKSYKDWVCELESYGFIHVTDRKTIIKLGLLYLKEDFEEAAEEIEKLQAMNESFEEDDEFDNLCEDDEICISIEE